ncbi:MAG: antibiotic resistance protein MarC [Acidobacteria bacterium]|nr:MAG: antibiotic resistance protein MarC [Acidobacteriota bacterium]
MLLALKFLPLTFSALLPVINPIGSALVLLGLVGPSPPEVFRSLARKIAFSTTLFLLTIDVAGAAILAFFGISLPVVQFAGGFVLAAMGWNLLNQKDVATENNISASPAGSSSLGDKIFYPFTFPVTAGPGCIVVTLTLSAHASQKNFIDEGFAHLGILAGIILNSVAVYLSYAYAQKLTVKIPRQTVHGVLRVIAFILLCIGVQIAWKGLDALILSTGKT